jgi:glutamine amidotransferase
MALSVAIVRYNAGNIRSVVCALARLGVDATVTDDPLKLASAARIIFPGVGEASSAMHHLKASGLDETLRSLRQPFLGICLGMQLMCRHSSENDTDCLGLFDAPVVRFQSGGIKVPHMGWNTVHELDTALFAGVDEGAWCYFVHSYHVPLVPETAATCTYGPCRFSAALAKDNFFGVQFHPEKSGPVGLRLLEHFIHHDWTEGSPWM